jgi:hypothetical protein
MGKGGFKRARSLLLFAGLLPATVEAGAVQLSWSPTPGAAGYRVHHGTAPGDFQQVLDIGQESSVDLVDLPNCAPSYFAVTAYNIVGESGYTPELSSWPRPTVVNVSAASLERGTQRNLDVSGFNFRAGDDVAFDNPGVEVVEVSVASCAAMTVTVDIAPDAPLGTTGFSVVHPSGVTGSFAGSLLVTAPIPPAVLDVQPPDGEVDLPVEVQPTIEFSESVLGASPSNLSLVNAQGGVIVQAPGSPLLSADGTVATIVPAAPLASGSTYRVLITGAAGIVDLDGHPLEAGYQQAEGFTTIGDDQPPTASEPAAGEVGGTTAVVEWSTDEATTGTVLFRKLGATLYQEAEGEANLLDHSVTLTGLEPETEYEFHVRSTDGSGNSTTSSPDRTFVTGSSPYAYIRFEAETGELLPPITSETDAGSFSGSSIAAAPGSGTGTQSFPLGEAEYSVHLPHDGAWKLWVRLLTPDGSSGSWFEAIDDGPLEAVADVEQGEWGWAAGRTHALAEGLHTIRLGGQEGGVLADRILLTDDPEFLPTEAPDLDVTPPAPVADPGALFTSGQVQLQWRNPDDEDLAFVVIRYRTDGEAPASPADGLPLAQGPAVPGADGFYLQTGVPEGATFHYGIFAVDAAGNASPVASTSTLALSPPAPPSGLTVYSDQ